MPPWSEQWNTQRSLTCSPCTVPFPAHPQSSFLGVRAEWQLSLSPCTPVTPSCTPCASTFIAFHSRRFPGWGQVGSQVEVPVRGESTELTAVLALCSLRRKQPEVMLKNLRSQGLQTFCVRMFSLDCAIFKSAQRGLCCGNICDSAKASALHAKSQGATGHHNLLTPLPLFMSWAGTPGKSMRKHRLNYAWGVHRQSVSNVWQHTGHFSDRARNTTEAQPNTPVQFCSSS